MKTKGDLIRNLSKLKTIQNIRLGDDESVTFSEDFIDKLFNLVLSIKHQPEIFPNARGNIQLEYEDNIKYLEIEITPDMKMNIFKIDADGNEYENDDFLDINIEVIIKEINEFYEN